MKNVKVSDTRNFALVGHAGDGKTSLGEAILHKGAAVGTTTSAGFGHTLGCAIALGYLPAELAREEDFEIEAFLTRWPAKRGPRCLTDPKGLRLKS